MTGPDVFEAMKWLPYSVAIAGLVFGLAGGVWAWRAQEPTRRAEAELVRLRTQLSAAEAARHEAENRLAAGNPEPAARAPGKDTPAEPPEPRWGPRTGPMDFSADPEIAPLLLKQRQRQLGARYAALYARLGLSPEMRGRLEVLLADKQLSRFEAMALARRQGLGREEAMALARQSDAEADNAIRALLGDAAYAQLQQYDQTYPQRAAVNSLATQLGYAGAALTTAQQEQLIALLADHAVVDEPAPDRGPTGGPGLRGRYPFGRDTSEAEIQAFLTNKAASDAAVLQEAARFLSPPQVAAVREAQEAETDQLRLAALRVRRMQAAAAGR